MKTRITSLVWGLLMCLFALMTACGGDESADPNNNGQNNGNGTPSTSLDAPDDIIDQAVAIVPGEAIKAESGLEGALPVWMVLVRTEVGSSVLVTIGQELESLIKLAGMEPPFDYDAEPGEGLINFAEVKETALEEIEGELFSWELVNEDIWLYKFRFEQAGSAVDLDIDAETGVPLG